INIVESNTKNIIWTAIVRENKTTLGAHKIFNLTAGRKYYLYVESFYRSLFVGPEIFDSSTIAFSYSRGDTSYKVKGFSYQRLAELLIGKLTSKTANIEITKGSVLDRIVFVSGDFARYTENGTKLKDSSLITSFKDFFKSTRAVAGY